MREPPRLLFITIILLGHAAAIQFLSVRIEVLRSEDTSGQLALPIRILLAPPPEANRPSAEQVNRIAPANAARRNVERAQVELEERQPSTAITLPAPMLEPESQVRPDWAAQAGQIARQLAGQGFGPHSFGQGGEEDELREPAAPNFFELDSPRKAGYIEMLGPGIERRWISSRCYRDFGRPPDRIAGTRPDLNPINCMVGPGAVRDDLFDHLKPDYLEEEN